MIVWVAIVVLFGATLLCYVGARRHKGMMLANVATVLFALATVAVVLDKAVFHAFTGRPGGSAHLKAPLKPGRLLGQGLRRHLKPGARIFFLVFVAPQSGGLGAAEAEAGDAEQGAFAHVAQWEQWQKGLSDGFGDVTWQVAGSLHPMEFTGKALQEVLAEKAGEADALVSLVGWPPDLDEPILTDASGESVPVGVYFPGRTDAMALRKRIEKGLIHAAVVPQADGSVTLYTKDNLP